ncbi:hypothetical protein MtrunA17_Chr1g0149011 [Medicago truncatula]|uniref:Transmembrane protein n=1 Tax=Medicago truncatula TaxID=3880 RepID=A0A396JHZ2_MEDTR|nr:hypothetical protein MtrunA17_Chr1g0149011 [Medicago truncatula]
MSNLFYLSEPCVTFFILAILNTSKVMIITVFFQIDSFKSIEPPYVHFLQFVQVLSLSSFSL